MVSITTDVGTSWSCIADNNTVNNDIVCICTSEDRLLFWWHFHNSILTSEERNVILDAEKQRLRSELIIEKKTMSILSIINVLFDYTLYLLPVFKIGDMITIERQGNIYIRISRELSSVLS
jgi:hypothetical protein